MCGRYSLFRIDELMEQYMLHLPEAPPPRYNIAPSQPVLALIQGPPYRGEWLQWGLIPNWARAGFRGLINARAETVAEKPSFRASFARRRCLIPADGFYEWSSEDGVKQPYRFALTDRSVFCFAGLWDRWTDPQGHTLQTCTILTTEPNDEVRSIHNRMPVILHPEDEARWLDPSQPPSALSGLLIPYPSGHMEKRSVSKQLNSPKNDFPELLAVQE